MFKHFPTCVVRVLQALLLIAGSQAEAIAQPIGTEPFSEPVRCITSPKTFKIEDEDMMFHSIKIIQGKKLILESREPGADLELDCEKKRGPDSKQNKYAFISQKKNPQSGISDAMTVLTLGITLLDENKPDLELNSRSEFPLHTSIKVSNLKDVFTVSDSKTGKSFRVECLFPVGAGVRISSRGQGDKQKVAFFVGSATKSSLDLAPKEKETNPQACAPTQYSLNIAKNSIEKSEILLKSSASATASGGK